MKFRLMVVAAALLMLTSLSFAQGFAAIFYSYQQVLTNRCAGGDPAPDGTVVTIYWDANGNGPDAADMPPTVCDLPPECGTGPAGTVNFNQFVVNGTDPDIDTGPGTFVTPAAFLSVGAMPVPARYYLKVAVPCQNWTSSRLYWTSDVFTLAVGLQDVDISPSQWHCWDDCGSDPICFPSGDVTLAYNPPIGPQNSSYGMTLCAWYPNAVLCVGPLLTQDSTVAASRRPHITLTYGSATWCTVPWPGSGWTFNGGYEGPWVLQYLAGQYYYCQQISIGAGTEGCATLTLDYILPVTMGSVEIVPLDRAVRLRWNTVSETGVTRFEIRRDGVVIARLEAVNSVTGHEYSYTDHGLTNGNVYTYELVLVNQDGPSEIVATQSVTPGTGTAAVTEYALYQNFPNPFNPTTSIRFDLVEKNFLTLKVFDITGREVATVVYGEREAGVNFVDFNGSRLTSGVYIYTLEAENVFVETRKMLLLK